VIIYPKISAMKTNIVFSVERNIDTQEFIDLLVDSSLGERRPVDDYERIKTMLQNANLIITAREHKKLIGIARALTDFAYCTYLSDLAIAKEYQKLGIGKQLIRRIKEEVPKANLILLSAPAAVDYYPKIGMKRHEAAFTLKEIADLKS
jgi:GNAT superfamily N-acetyltransferase